MVTGVEPPLGKLVTLTVPPGCWKGPPPQLGDWLGTTHGRISYEIGEVRHTRSGGMVLRCRRYRRGSEGTMVGHCWFTWTWAARDRKRPAPAA